MKGLLFIRHPILKRYNIPVGSLEKVTKDKIKKFFIDNGIWYKMPQPGIYGANNGTSDFQALHKGLFIAIEAKRNLSTAKPTAQQIEYINNVNLNGGFAMVVSCENDIIVLDGELRKRGIIE